MAQHNEDADLRFAQGYFASLRIEAERIPEGKTKTPDLRLRQDGRLVGYCEVKSPQEVFAKQVKRAVAEAPPGKRRGILEIGGPYGTVSRPHYCMLRFATKAEAQLKAVNPEHDVPNLVMLVNHDTHSYHDDFREAVTGYFGSHRTLARRLRDEVPEIDAYLWADRRPGPQAEPVEVLFGADGPLRETVRALLKR